MNIYAVVELENQIEQMAREHDGEIPESLLKELVEAQTKSLTQIEDLVKYTRKLELGIEMCKAEEARIKAMREKAERRIESIGKYLTPYVAREGKLEAGTFTLFTRKSKAVILDVDFKEEQYITKKIVETPDKTAIKKALEAGRIIPGARLEERDNLQIK